MKEVKIVAWCDHEDHTRPDRPREATNSFAVTVNDVGPREVDLCDEHALPFIEVFTVLEDVGTFVTKRKGNPGNKGGGRVKENLPNPPCPDCGEQYKDRHALGAHSRETHGKKLIDLLPPEQLGISARKQLARRAQEREAQAS